MASSGKLATWLADNANALNLQVIEFDWVRSWELNGFHDIQISIELAGKKFVGRGTALGSELAFIKAGAEVIERAYCAGHGVHSTGVAAHNSAIEAKTNAENEIIERDAFFRHFYSKRGFYHLGKVDCAELDQVFSRAIDRARLRGVDVSLYQAFAHGRTVYVAVANGLQASPRWGGIVGLASRSQSSEAIRAAFLECIRNVAAVLDGGVPAILTQAEFEQLNEPKSSDRQRLALNPEYWMKMSHLFPGLCKTTENCLVRPTQENSVEWHFDELTCPFLQLESAPLVVWRARPAEQRTEEFCRASDHSPTTMTGLVEFLGRPVDRDSLETAPHFLG